MAKEGLGRSVPQPGAKVIVEISWDYAFECMELEVGRLRPGAVVRTWEVWEDREEPIQYNPVCAGIELLGSGEHALALVYEEADHLHLPEDVRAEIPWGVTELVLHARTSRAKARYYEQEDQLRPSPWVRCRVESSELLDILRAAKTVEVLDRREQQRLRKDLLARDRYTCAISGVRFSEDHEAVLDAAHIIPHKEHGAARTHNAFMLRTDIHRLFDRHMIGVHPDGAIWRHDSLSGVAAYSDLLERIAPAVLQRVNRALAKRANWLQLAGVQVPQARLPLRKPR